MIKTTPRANRFVAFGVAAVALTGLFIGGSAIAANAEMDPNNGPAQTLPFDEPGTGVGGNWTTSSWVADQYTLTRWGSETRTYERVDGAFPKSGDADNLRANLNLGGCVWYSGDKFITCHN